MMNSHARKITCNAGDKVFVRMDKKHDKFAGKQYLVVTGTIIKQCKNNMYEVQLEHGIYYVVLDEKNQNRNDELQGESDTQLPSPLSNVERRNGEL